MNNINEIIYTQVRVKLRKRKISEYEHQFVRSDTLT